PFLVQPDRLDDAEHPAVEPGAWGPLGDPGESALARGLYQIVRLVCCPGEAARKATQPRQERHQLGPYTIVENRHQRRPPARKWAARSTVRQRRLALSIPAIEHNLATKSARAAGSVRPPSRSERENSCEVIEKSCTSGSYTAPRATKHARHGTHAVSTLPPQPRRALLGASRSPGGKI